MKRFFFLIISLICLNFCFAQTEDYPIIEKNGRKYYVYTIQQGDGLFAIARKFGMKQNDLHDANENLSPAIKAGDKILIPIYDNVETIKNNASTTHIVEAKETLYSISRLYNVPVDTLIALNPNAKNGIKTGETITISINKKINTKQSDTTAPKPIVESAETEGITHVVQKKETLYSLSKKYNIAIHELIALNPELQYGLKAGSTIRISMGKEDETKESETKEQTIQKGTITIESNPDSIKPLNLISTPDSTALNIVYLLPLVAENSNEEKNQQRFIEFYRGSLLALNKAKQDGISANVYTYNLPKSSKEIQNVLKQLNDKDIDVVIGPAYSEQLNQVLSYTKKRNITTIVPISNNIDTAYYYPKLIQFNPSQDSLFNTIIEDKFRDNSKQYILAQFEKCQNKGNVFLNSLSESLTENGIKYTKLTIKPELVDSIASMISNDTTILVLGSSLINDVAPIIDSLSHYQLPLLQVWGFEEWGLNIIKRYPQTMYYSLFNPSETEEYKETYKNWFGIRKQTVGVKYDLLGYDLTTLALKELRTSDLILQPKYLQSEPKLEYIDGRWLNTNYYILFWDNITIKKIN